VELSQGLISVPGIRQIKYIKEVATRKPEIRNGILCTISFFCFVKVMENKTGTSAFFSIAMKVEVWLCICLHGKDAAKMF
jgi:hypothetical protein